MNFQEITKSELKIYYPDVYQGINKTYPIGLAKSDSSYYQFDGIKNVLSQIASSISDSEYYYEYWERKICHNIGLSTGKKVIPSTYGNVPSLSGHIPLDDGNNPRNTSFLYFYVSIVAKYFSIEIITFNKLKSENVIPGYGKIFIPGVTGVTVSPEGEYHDIFLSVEIALREEFKDYKLLPSAFDFMNLDGLNVIQNDLTNNPVSGAFFSKVVRDSDTKIIGDMLYGDIVIKTP